MSDVSIRAGRRRIRISHADRVVFPDPGLTKEDLARHYATVGPVMVPHVRDRPPRCRASRGASGRGGSS
jgi:DNA primase